MSRKQEQAEKAARDSIQIAASLLSKLEQTPDIIRSVANAGKLLSQSSNRVIVTGIGKSGLIARKIAATLTSTGSPAVFLHPTDALHGDMGNVQNGEVVIAISNSGETREILELLPSLRLLGAKIIALSGNATSTLVEESDHALCYPIEKEGCPLELAPMASTTASLVLGDALAAYLITIKEFKATDFGKFHPAGSLGKKLLTKVHDVMQPSENAVISKYEPMSKLLDVLVSTNLGCVLCTGSKGHLRGIITDGDIKRWLSEQRNSSQTQWNQEVKDVMTESPLMTREDVMVEECLRMMQSRAIYQLPVVDKEKRPVGILRMHDLIGF